MLEMQTRNFDVRLHRTCGFRRILPRFQYQSCLDVAFLMAKRYVLGLEFLFGRLWNQLNEGNSLPPLKRSVPYLRRLIWQVSRTLRSLLSLPTPGRYVGRNYPDTLKTGYIIMSYVTDGAMLSKSWGVHRHDSSRRSNLFHGLARIMLSLGKPRLPRIGSFTLDNSGIISLTNRPSLYDFKRWKMKASAQTSVGSPLIQQ